MAIRNSSNLLLAGALLASCVQAVHANDGPVASQPLLFAQARGTAAAAGTSGGSAAKPSTGGNAATAPRSTGTAGAAGTGAGTAADPGPTTGRANAATAPVVPESSRSGTGANNPGVTARDPSSPGGAALDAVPPADANTPTPLPDGGTVVIVPPPGNGVTIRDPMHPDGAGSLDDAERPAPHAQPIQPARTRQEELTAALRSCQGLPGGEKAACEREARRLHDRM